MLTSGNPWKFARPVAELQTGGMSGRVDVSKPELGLHGIVIASRPLAHNYAVASGDWRHDLVEQQYLWQKEIHRVVAEGISPEQAIDEAIARIKRILSE